VSRKSVGITARCAYVVFSDVRVRRQGWAGMDALAFCSKVAAAKVNASPGGSRKCAAGYGVMECSGLFGESRTGRRRGAGRHNA